jgi:hypothetical protein
MSEEDVDNHVLRKYSLLQKLGKGVSLLLLLWAVVSFEQKAQHLTCAPLQAYGVVWKAVDKKNQNLVALKKIFDAFQNATDAQVSSKTCSTAAQTLHDVLVCYRLAMLAADSETLCSCSVRSARSCSCRI